MIILQPKAQAELRTLYQLRAAAETNLVLYLSGILDALGVDRDRFLAFDDETGELLLRPEEDAVADPSTVQSPGLRSAGTEGVDVSPASEAEPEAAGLRP